MAKRIVYYKCPFSCDKKFDREKLLKHVDDKHQDELPEGFSSLRYVFHYVNKKPLEYHGICTECKGPTEWDEKIGRYKRQCGSKTCHDSYVKKFEENMVKKTGHKRVTDTQEGLEEMLKRRKISGVYTFKNGAKKEYVGSYEKHCLEFMDKVMDIDPNDIMSPGPTMEYILEGKKHYYITDFYYQPYNLIIEVKDGGDNPNKRNMPEYRKKQMAKEKFIIDNTDYNYIRLTNNDMGQLLTVMADLKMQLVDGSNDRVIHVNEDGFRDDPYEIKVRNNNITESSASNFIRYDLNDSKASEYFKNLKMNKDDYSGEVLVDNKSKEEIGHVLVGNKKDKGYITDLCVESKYRRQGFGSMLLKDAINKYGGIDLSVEKSNDIALDMYKSNDFVIIKEYEEKGKTLYYMKLKSKLSKDDKVISENTMPICPKCNSSENVVVKIAGEPIFYCKACNSYVGDVPIDEGLILNSKDIYYNKAKFDNGEINICFITGLSGSGKSTMARGMEENGVEKYELDDVMSNFWFSDNNLKEYGDLIYSFFKGAGKRYRMEKEPDWKNMKNGADPWYTDEFEKGMIKDFVNYSIQYANSHKNKKFVIEGVELYWFIEPSELKDYAVYIKGTSVFLSRLRGAIRDSSDAQAGKRMKAFWQILINRKRAKAFAEAETHIIKWRKYFKSLEKESLTEASTSEFNDDLEKNIIMNAEKLKKEEKIFTSEQGMVNYLIKIRTYRKWLRGRSELLLFKGNAVLLALDPDGKGYTLPGGGWELNENHARSAQRECEEEVGYYTTTPKYIMTYVSKFPPRYWVRTKIPAQYWWYGEYNELFCAEYDGIYTRKVSGEDAEPFMNRNAKFYDINMVWNLLIPPHQKAIKRYFNKLNNPFSPTFIP